MEGESNGVFLMIKVSTSAVIGVYVSDEVFGGECYTNIMASSRLK